MHRTHGRKRDHQRKRTLSNDGIVKSLYPNPTTPGRPNSSENNKSGSITHQCTTSCCTVEDINTRDRQRLHLRVLSAFLSQSGWTDLIFLCLVVVAIWRMASTTLVRHRQYHGTLRDATSRIRQLETLEPLKSRSERGGSVPFQSTHACAATQDEKAPCKIHFPVSMNEEEPSTRVECNPDFCLRQQNHPRSNEFKRDHGALLRPLLFDGKQPDRKKPLNNTMSTPGQLLVLADGLSGSDEEGNNVAEIVSRHLPLFLLEPFHRYAKPFSKIHKIISHAFEAMDRSLYEQQRQLWKNAGATALIIMQHGQRLFLASAGTNVGFLARYDSEIGQAIIVKRVQPHTPDASGENRRISKLGGIVGKQKPVSRDNNMLLYESGSSGDAKATNGAADSDNDVFRVFLAGDSKDEGIPSARVIGGGRWKFKGVVSVPTIEEVDLSKLLYKEAPEKNQFFLVAASDGLLNQKPKDPNGLYAAEQDLASRLGKVLYDDSLDRGVSLEQEISAILRESASSDLQKTNDDRTLMVTKVMLEQQ